MARYNRRRQQRNRQRMQRSRFQHIRNQKIHYGDHTWTIYGNLRDATALYNQNTGGDWNAPTDGCPGVQCPCDGGWSAPCSCNANGTISCPSCICETEMGELQYRAGGMMSRRSRPRRRSGNRCIADSPGITILNCGPGSSTIRVGHGAGNSPMAHIYCQTGINDGWTADCDTISEDSGGQVYNCPECNGVVYFHT